MAGFASLLERISGSASRAWDVSDRGFDLAREGHSILHLGIGDPDLDTSPVIVRSVRDALKAGRTHYSPLAGEPALRAAVAVHAQALYATDVHSEHVAICAGAQSALYAVFQLIAGAGDEVIVFTPYYATYPAAVTAGGATMVSVPLDAGKGFAIDIEAVRAAITSQTRAILVNSPSNPTGAIIDRATMGQLLDLAQAAGLWLVSDEVYWSLCYDGPHVSPLQLGRHRDRIIVVNSLSKSHAMSGFRIGWAVGPHAVIDAMTTLAQSFHFGVNQFAQDAAVVALSNPDIAIEIQGLFRERRDALAAGLAQYPALRFHEAQGGMFLLVDISATGIDALSYANGLLDAEGVVVIPGIGFGADCTGMVRIGFLLPPDQLADAAQRIGRYTETLLS